MSKTSKTSQASKSKSSDIVKHFSELGGRTDADMANLRTLSRGPADTSDIPELNDEAAEAARIVRRGSTGKKVPVTIRLDQDLVDWFKGLSEGGEGYQTRINEALREYRAEHSDDGDAIETLRKIEVLAAKVRRRITPAA